MSSGALNRVSKQSELGFIPGETCSQALGFQSQEGAQSQQKVVFLAGCAAHLRLFYRAALLESAMVVLDAPARFGPRLERFPRHLAIAGRPVLDLAFGIGFLVDAQRHARS